MKVNQLSEQEADKMAESMKTTTKGKWKELCEQVKKTRKPVKVTDITRGQGAAIHRTAKEQGCRVKVQYIKDGGAYALIQPPLKE